MKDWIIKKLGGYTKEDYMLEKDNLKKHTFRSGDLVYVRKIGFNPKRRYYLLDSYNNGYCWYVSEDANDKLRRELINGIHIRDISHEEMACHVCGQ